jgi:peptidoglycan-associated lipoprotein
MRLKSSSLVLVALSAAVLVLAGCAGHKTAQLPPAASTPPPQAVTPVPATTTPAPATTTTPPDANAGRVKVEDLKLVYFAYQSDALDQAAQDALNDNAKTLRDHPDMKVEVGGHCDERGSVSFNLSLGDKRAQAVRKYLVDAGVSADQLTAVSYGKERPADEGHDESAWAKNRRAAFTARP